MSTIYHTAIATGAAGNASVFNAPLGQIDAALDDAKSTVAADHAEIVAARDTYVSLDARLDSLENLTIVAGGNVVTTANGAASAGQKIVTVVSTAGFVAGASVEYLLNDITLEYNTIDAVTDATHLLLDNNIGTGGILSGGLVALISTGIPLAANAIHHGATDLTLPQAMEYANGSVFNTAAYGAVGDGSTDDTVALNAIWAAMSPGDTLALSPGKAYAISDTLDWSDKEYVTIIGNSATIIARAAANFTNKAMINLAGSTYSSVTGLRTNCTLASNRPKASVVLGRVDAGDGGGMRFSDCWFSGAYAHSVLYDVGSELTSFWHCRWQTDVAGIPCYYSSSTDDASLVVQDSVSNVCKRFYDCTFLDYSNTATGQILIEMRGVTKEIIFRDCYCALSGAGKVINLAGTSASFYGLIIDNMRVEGPAHADSRLLYCGQDNWCEGTHISGITWPIVSDFVIEIGSTSALSNSYLQLMYDLSGSTKWIKVSQSLIQNFIIVQDAATISIDSGEAASANAIVSFGNGSPFTGAGYNDYFLSQSNMVSQLYTSGPSLLSVARQRVEGSTIGGTSATPSVLESSLLELAQTAATDVTNFSDMVNGQKITLIGTNTNTTLKHGATIKLAGATDYVSEVGGTITLIYNAHTTAWYEIGRMDPS